MPSGIDKTGATPVAEPVDMKLEVVLLEVSDVDRATAFYEKLGWRLDIDIVADDFHPTVSELIPTVLGEMRPGDR